MTAEEVKRMQIGERVVIRKEGGGPVVCTVAFNRYPADKFLTWRKEGRIRRFAIRDYPEMQYERYRADDWRR